VNIILSRHGNTFGPQDKVVWAGSRNDLPLVARGVEQAERFAEVLKARQIKPAAIFSGPLERTFHYAEIITQKLALSFKPFVDLRLNEIDYGDWTGLTQKEVKERFGEEELTSWDEHSVWPSKGNWGGSEESVKAEVHAFVGDLIQGFKEDETVIVVSSNGRLRFFLRLIEGELEQRMKQGSFKVKTGNICKLKHEKSQLNVVYWNQEPKADFEI